MGSQTSWQFSTEHFGSSFLKSYMFCVVVAHIQKKISQSEKSALKGEGFEIQCIPAMNLAHCCHIDHFRNIATM